MLGSAGKTGVAVVVAYVVETELKTLVAVCACLSRCRIAEPCPPSVRGIGGEDDSADVWSSLSGDDHTEQKKIVHTVEPNSQHRDLSRGHVPLHILVNNLFTVSK